MTRTLAALATAAAAGAGLILTGCQATQSTGPTPAPPSSSPSSAADTRLAPAAEIAALATLKVKGRAPMTAYSRAQFGPAWPKENGCDARNVVLARDLTSTAFRSGGCIVTTGTLVSPYNGTVIHFVRGRESAKVQIDHVVSVTAAAKASERACRDVSGMPLTGEGRPATAASARVQPGMSLAAPERRTRSSQALLSIPVVREAQRSGGRSDILPADGGSPRLACGLVGVPGLGCMVVWPTLGNQ